MKNLIKKIILVVLFFGCFFISFSFARALESDIFNKDYVDYIDADLEDADTNYDEIYSDINTKKGKESSQKNLKEEEEIEVYDLEDAKSKRISVKEATYKFFLLVLIFFGLFLIVKALLERAKANKDLLFNEKPGFFEGITGKFKGSISSVEGLKLRQMIVLKPGQNLYLVELDGRKMLLGGTHMGGIQLVSDLSALEEVEVKNEKQNNFNFSSSPITKNIRKNDGYDDFFNTNGFDPSEIFIQNDNSGIASAESNISKKNETPFLTPNLKASEKESYNSNEISEDDNPKVRKISKRPFKRRVNFRQSLISS